MADAADLKSAGAILVGSSPTPGTRWETKIPWPITMSGYLLSSIPTGYHDHRGDGSYRLQGRAR